jgi:hypothetical protein
MKKLLFILPLGLCLAGCPMDGYLGQPSAGTAAAPSTPMNLTTFLSRLESARGTALTTAEKTAVGGAVQQTRSLLDGGQQRFIGAVSQVSGLDPATLGILESKAGRKLGGIESQAAKAAASLRNNSLASLKTNLAGRVAKEVGMDAAFVEGLLPLLGF